MLVDHNQFVFYIWCNIKNKKSGPLFKSKLIDFIHTCRGDDLFNTEESFLTKAQMVKKLAYDKLNDDIERNVAALARSSFSDGIQKALIFTDAPLKKQCGHDVCQKLLEKKLNVLKARNIVVQIWSLEQNQYSFTEDIHFPLDSWQNLGEILKGEHGEVSRKRQDFN